MGDDADLTKLPVHLQHGYDGAPFISASIDYCVDRLTGLTNVGIRRLMLRGRRETGPRERSTNANARRTAYAYPAVNTSGPNTLGTEAA